MCLRLCLSPLLSILTTVGFASFPRQVGSLSNINSAITGFIQPLHLKSSVRIVQSPSISARRNVSAVILGVPFNSTHSKCSSHNMLTMRGEVRPIASRITGNEALGTA